MKKGVAPTDKEMERAIELFKETKGLGTIVRLLRDETGRHISSATVGNRLRAAGFWRNMKQAKQAKSDRYWNGSQDL